MNLNAAGVVELNVAELEQTEGGLVKEIIEELIDAFSNWDAYVASFKEGYAAGRKFGA